MWKIICFVCSRVITNKYLLKHPSKSFDVEWGYAFDVHLNAFYPLLVILHFLQLFFINHVVVINSDWFVGYFVGNTLWLIAVGYYLYITFLGYNGKSHLQLNRFSLNVSTLQWGDSFWSVSGGLIGENRLFEDLGFRKLWWLFFRRKNWRLIEKVIGRLIDNHNNCWLPPQMVLFQNKSG